MSGAKTPSQRTSTTLAAVTTDRLGINRANNWKSHIEQSEWRIEQSEWRE